MKMSHQLASRTAGPLWGLLFGVMLTVAGVAFGYYLTASGEADRGDESLAVAAVVLGVSVAVYAARELLRKPARASKKLQQP
ncbi:hypothetical protein ACFQ3P_37935 [Paraburkholderia sabiae]|uniref:Uncharacterized protein n=1 Tax=Paraburkholderia sabiae TaxID=273251 RepID=A0ABU9QM13_9BURK|nr:hypothetical protein [Paraburkholderia sabiae]WJZ79966.1 hypothetical protein QEN71_43235 [Paraburkholderia sabiae]CAD6561247.1 hypothetical protein LMG24235_07235 [Paraburkholderia sabiae]